VLAKAGTAVNPPETKANPAINEPERESKFRRNRPLALRSDFSSELLLSFILPLTDTLLDIKKGRFLINSHPLTTFHPLAFS